MRQNDRSPGFSNITRPPRNTEQKSQEWTLTHGQLYQVNTTEWKYTKWHERQRKVTTVTKRDERKTALRHLKLTLEELKLVLTYLQEQDREKSPEEGDDMTLYTLESDRVQRFRDVTYVTSAGHKGEFRQYPLRKTGCHVEVNHLRG